MYSNYSIRAISLLSITLIEQSAMEYASIISMCIGSAGVTEASHNEAKVYVVEIL